MSNVLLKTKLTNQLKKEAIKHNIDIEIKLSNISVNGDKRGCSGHVMDVKTGVCTYLNTECIPFFGNKCMYRLADNFQDYSSNKLINGNNRWVEKESLAYSVIKLITTENPVCAKPS